MICNFNIALRQENFDDDKVYNFFIWHISKFLKIIPELYCRYGFFETCWGAVEQIVTNWWKKNVAQNEQDFAEVWISTAQRPGSGACWEAF